MNAKLKESLEENSDTFKIGGRKIGYWPKAIINVRYGGIVIGLNKAGLFARI